MRLTCLQRHAQRSRANTLLSLCESSRFASPVVVVVVVVVVQCASAKERHTTWAGGRAEAMMCALPGQSISLTARLSTHFLHARVVIIIIIIFSLLIHGWLASLEKCWHAGEREREMKRDCITTMMRQSHSCLSVLDNIFASEHCPSLYSRHYICQSSIEKCWHAGPRVIEHNMPITLDWPNIFARSFRIDTSLPLWIMAGCMAG